MRLLRPTPGECADRQGILHLKIQNAKARGLAADHFIEEHKNLSTYLQTTWLEGASAEVRARFEQKAADLQAVNARIWDLEDTIRGYLALPLSERSSRAAEIAETAMAPSAENDERAALIADMNALFDHTAPEKLYQAQTPAPAPRGRVELLRPSCNMDTVTDGRGGIFTWLPKEPLVEFNLLYFQPGKTRGHHYHPEFHEYFLVVEGQGVMVARAEGGGSQILHMAKGSCTRTPMGMAHAFYAITAVTAIAMLSKRWDDCHPPILHMDALRP